LPVSDSGSSSVPWWVWLLALAAVAAAVVSIVALRRSGGRRKDWEAGYAEGIAESRWLADSLLPTLIAVPGAAERVGGWTVARPRVVALEARLEGLHATAEDELARTRVHTLRSGVLAARETLDGLAAPAMAAATGSPPDLPAAKRRLDDALDAVAPPPQPPVSPNAPPVDLE
jgi:hypothetical protein